MRVCEREEESVFLCIVLCERVIECSCYASVFSHHSLIGKEEKIREILYVSIEQ